ncbi:di-trans,poly-cis-decaprenylcistransferase [Candidatus Gottesmanbacteria bacterium RBG_16_52_11]|uniref:Isoprenyl transferase n=1 Tax=Candidatus Gottesmanbacteria bacterium RBG_16_52_11 TaxID=1798374 RepID=A0A1F5YNT0_9BACT|nr:MAG: di-trans,poly-cis-decaprenylcistransferase [Candidatus Gottesmanbacteria bacterium RBG_16_52_11]
MTQGLNRQETVPAHIAVIMDGNRRWARRQGLPVLSGHRKVAAEVLEPLVEHAFRRGVKYLTFWAFSTENWNRDAAEVRGIMRLFRDMIGRFGTRMHRKGIRIRTIGDLSRLEPALGKSIRELVDLTSGNTNITVTFAVNYGGRDEIVRAVGRLAADPEFNSRNSGLTEDEFGKYMDTDGIPDPDLIIRTGGEQRLSGFLLWQCRYSELYFPSFTMPEFTPERLDEAIAEYASRQRRFGK